MHLSVNPWHAFERDIRAVSTLIEINERIFGKTAADLRQHLTELVNARQASLQPTQAIADPRVRP
jgi:hypothetical protein